MQTFWHSKENILQMVRFKYTETHKASKTEAENLRIHQKRQMRKQQKNVKNVLIRQTTRSSGDYCLSDHHQPMISVI